MEYISAEEFLKQPKEVQKVFLDWWEPSVGDLIGIKTQYIDLSWNTITKYKVSCISEDDIFNYDSKKELLDSFKTLGYQSYSDEIVLLFTEGCLRWFIENKTKLLLEVQNFGKQGYCIHLNDSEWVEEQYNNLGTDLLKAYWKVALEIINKEITTK